MTYFKWLAAALVFSASACGSSNSAYRSDYPYSPGAYGYNQPSTYYQTRYTNGQPAYYAYGNQAQPVYDSSQPVYYYNR